MARFMKLTRPSHTVGMGTAGGPSVSSEVPERAVWVNLDNVAYIDPQKEGHLGKSVLTFAGLDDQRGQSVTLTVEEDPGYIVMFANSAS